MLPKNCVKFNSPSYLFISSKLCCVLSMPCLSVFVDKCTVECCPADLLVTTILHKHFIVYLCTILCRYIKRTLSTLLGQRNESDLLGECVSRSRSAF